jgi:hypothetical protein
METLGGFLEGERGEDALGAGGPRRLDGQHGFDGIRHSLDQQRVGAALEQGGSLLAEGDLDLGRVRVAKRLKHAAERTDITEHPGAIARDIAGQLGGGEVDLPDACAGAVATEHIRGAAKRVCREQVGARGEVVAVHLPDAEGLLKVPQFPARAGGEAELLQLRAHGAIHQEGAAGQGRAEQGGARVHAERAWTVSMNSMARSTLRNGAPTVSQRPSGPSSCRTFRASLPSSARICTALPACRQWR